MNETIRVLTNHRTTRTMVKGHQMPSEHLDMILKSSMQSPTWMNGQHYSIIVVSDQSIKEKLVALSPRNPHVETSSVFLLYCLDMSHLAVASEYRQQVFNIQDNVEVLLTATTDTAIAMQSAVMASESLGYGTVCVGGIRQVADQLIELFELPQYVYPLCGVSIGKVDTMQPIERVKPRFPKVFENVYRPIQVSDVQHYDYVMSEFADARETKEWSQKFADYYKQNPNENTQRWMKEQGF